MVRTKILKVIEWFFFLASGVVWVQIKVDATYWAIKINSVAEVNDEDQSVAGSGKNPSTTPFVFILILLYHRILFF